MDFKDIQIKCVTCGREFIFTAREQEFFSSKGFKEPRHCRECRQLRKQDRGKGTEVVSHPSSQAQKNAYQVVCAQCQRETFVPFRPITGKPVLCKDCFIAQRYGSAPKPTGEIVEKALPRPESDEVAATQILPTPPSDSAETTESQPSGESAAERPSEEKSPLSDQSGTELDSGDDP